MNGTRFEEVPIRRNLYEGTRKLLDIFSALFYFKFQFPNCLGKSSN